MSKKVNWQYFNFFSFLSYFLFKKYEYKIYYFNFKIAQEGKKNPNYERINCPYIHKIMHLYKGFHMSLVLAVLQQSLPPC